MKSTGSLHTCLIYKVGGNRLRLQLLLAGSGVCGGIYDDSDNDGAESAMQCNWCST